MVFLELNLLRPKKSVHEAFKKPDLGLAFILVILPAIVSAIGNLLFGLKLDFLLIVYSIISGIASWAAMAIVLYIVCFVIGGSALKGKFSGILSSISLIWVFFLAMTIIGMLVVASMPSGVTGIASNLKNGQISEIQAYSQLNEKMNGQGNEIVSILLSAIVVVLALIVICLIFLVIGEAGVEGIGKQIFSLIVFIVAWAIVTGLVRMILP